ncbi:conserved hypothetical protein [Histoplasma capsulatum var. duboisii H88]|uniref:PKc-like superfamily domain-containing protein n=1 Tax=Ajellomyces capsulatus (strain H88) TaxID=544711 RepID=F0U883_AJEC8|nr:conserved hypothetical protein [Histoplasma capsulatum var. duboisii H88]QSS51879.1 PKc-like superfamily domain-containing protein [Histoplasma capsulatum var. duboisii H88]
MAEQQPLYNIGPFRSSNKNTDTQLNVYVSDKHFKIDLFTANFESSPVLLAEYLQHVQRLDPEYIPDNTEEDEEFEDPLYQMHDWVLQPFVPIFRKLAPLDQSQKYTLADCLFAEEFHYTVQAVEESLVPVYLGNSNAKEHHLIGARLPSSIYMGYSMFPIYHPSTIQIPIDSRSLPAVPHKVFIHGRPNPSFFKIVYRGDVGITLKELLTYSKIHTAKFDATVRTSRFEGLVEDDDGRVMGLLLSYIDCQGTTLQCIDGRDPRFSELRKKWLDQVTVTLKHLHSQGIIWGDAKAANILIDVNGDAYLIDFGGGYTQGWVGRENANSIDGDLQGLERIKWYLFK